MTQRNAFSQPGRPSAASLVLALFAVSALSAAQAPQLAETVEVELVDVELWVTDQRGERVEALTAADFALEEDGVPVAIDHFVEVRDGAVVGQPADVSRQVLPHLVVYWDGQRLHPADRKPLVRDLREFLSSEAVSSERVLILHQEQALSVAVPFGSPKRALLAGLDRLAEAPASGVLAGSRQVLGGLQDLWARTEDTAGDRGLQSMVSRSPRAGVLEPAGSGGAGAGASAAAGGGGGGSAASASGAAPQACRDFVTQVQPMTEGLVQQRGLAAASSVRGLWDTMSFLAGVEGPKTLLYLSGGLETQPGAALASFLRGVCPGESMEFALDTAATDIGASVLQLSQHANSNRVTFYGVYEEGRRSSSMQSSAQRRTDLPGAQAFLSDQEAADRHGIQVLSDATGGRAVLSTGRLRSELESIGEEMRNFYSLAYRPRQGRELGEHTVRVDPDNEAHAARHRSGYRDRNPDQWLTDRLLGAAYLGLVDNALDVRLGAGAVAPADSGRLALPLHVMVAAERLVYLQHDEGAEARLLLRAISLAVDGGSASVAEKRFRVPESARDSGGWLDLSVEMEVEAGERVVAVALEDQGAGEASLVSTTLTIEPPAAGPGD